MVYFFINSKIRELQYFYPMDERRKIDLKQHTLPPVSKRYIIRIIFYVLVLGIIAFGIYTLNNRPKKVRDGGKIQEIKGVQLDTIP